MAILSVAFQACLSNHTPIDHTEGIANALGV